MSSKSVTIIGPEGDRAEAWVDPITHALLVKVVNPSGGGGGGDVNLTEYGGVAVGAANAIHVQPGTGATFAVTQSTSPWVVSGTVAATQSGTWTVECVQDTSPWVIAGVVAVSNFPAVYPVNDNGGSLTVDGTLAVTQSTSPWVVSGTVSAAQSGSWIVDVSQVTHAALNATVRVQDGDGAHLMDIIEAFETVAVFTQKGPPPMFLCSSDPAAAVNSFCYGYISEGGRILADVTGSVNVATDGLTVLSVGGFGANHLGKREDDAHATLDVGVMALSVRQDTDAPYGANGDYTPLSVNATGRLKTNTHVMGAGGLILQIVETSLLVTTPTQGPTVLCEVVTSPTVVGEGRWQHIFMKEDGGVMVHVANAASIGDVIPGTGASNLGKAEDAPHASGHVGVMALAVQSNTAASTAANGDYVPFLTDASGRLHVNVGDITPGVAATSLGKAEDAVHVSGDTGVMALAVRTDSVVALAANGDYHPLQVDAIGRLYCNVGQVFPGSTATSLGKLEDAAHTTGDTGVAVWAVRNDAGSTLVDANGDYAPLSVDANGNLRATITGIVPGTAATQLCKAEDAAHASGDAGVAVWAVRQDVMATFGATGDYTPFTVDRLNRLRIMKEGGKITYRASTTAAFAAANGAAMFFAICGSSTRTINVQRIRVSGFTLTAVQFLNVVCEKWSTAPTGGTSTTLTQVPLDSSDAAGTSNLCVVYTVAPTEGTLVGTIGTQMVLGQATVAVAASIPPAVEFDFRNRGENTATVLRGTAQALSLAFGTAPASAVTVVVEVEWTEET